MRQLLHFYMNEVNSSGITLDNILDWSDYKLQSDTTYINWLFPSATSANKGNRLTPGAVYRFRTYKELRIGVKNAVLRFISFLGYSFVHDTLDVIEIKPLYREENGTVIGLYNSNTFEKIGKAFTFLETIRMDNLSTVLFLVVCRVMKIDPEIKALINTHSVLQGWIKTQPYLVERDRYKMEEALIDTELEDWERSASDEEKPIALVGDAWDD